MTTRVGFWSSAIGISTTAPESIRTLVKRNNTGSGPKSSIGDLGFEAGFITGGSSGLAVNCGAAMISLKVREPN